MNIEPHEQRLLIKHHAPRVTKMIDPNLPLMDLHRHLDGSVRLETILDLGRQHDLPLPAWDVEQLRPHIQMTQPEPDVLAFIAKFYWMTGVLADYQACKRVAYESVEDAQCEGLDYVELRFSPWFMAEPHGLDPAGVVEAVTDGVTEALESGYSARLCKPPAAPFPGARSIGHHQHRRSRHQRHRLAPRV